MIVLSPISTPAKQVVCFCERDGRQMSSHARFVVSQLSPKSCCSHGEYQPRYEAVTINRRSPNSSTTASLFVQGCCIGSCFSKLNNNSDKFKIKSVGSSSMGHGTKWLGISSPSQNMNLRLLLPKHDMITKIKWSAGSGSQLLGGTSAGVAFGLSVCYSCSEPAYSEASREENNDMDDIDSSSVAHGKKVHTNYSITGIPGDGRCLFRSVAHGDCLRSGKPVPNKSLQQRLADELRAKVADEFVKRREETEWFIEGDFDQYVSQMRKPHVWGGEPELLMASHVLQMPITVYMYDEKAGGLIAIAEYGQEYGKDDPIRVLYHGFGHYDALQMPSKCGKSRLARW